MFNFNKQQLKMAAVALGVIVVLAVWAIGIAGYLTGNDPGNTLNKAGASVPIKSGR